MALSNPWSGSVDWVKPGATTASSGTTATTTIGTGATAPVYGQGVKDLLGSSYSKINAANTSLEGTDITGLDTVSPTALSDYATADEDTGIAKAQGIMQTGDLKEATAYNNAASIANANARLATIGGQIQQSQENIKITKELGGQQADISGAGFGNSGSAVYLMRASKYQGALANQLYGTNASLTAGGYASQGAASEAQADAADTAAGYAGQLADNALTAADNATKQGNLAQALSLNTAAGKNSTTTTGTTTETSTATGFQVYNSDGTKAKAGSTDNSAFSADAGLVKSDLANSGPVKYDYYSPVTDVA